MSAEKVVRVMPGTLDAKFAFGWKVRRQFYSQVMAQNANGVSLGKCLDLYEARAVRSKAWKLAAIARAMKSKMANGFDFAEAVEAWVPLEESSQIAAGVLGQNLPLALKNLIESKEVVREVTSHVRNALMTPLAHVAIGIAFFIFMAMTIVPQFEGIIPKSAASGSVAALYDIRDFVVSWWFWTLLVLFVVLIAAVIYSLPRWTGRSRMAADNYWPFNLYKEFQGYLWMTGFVSIVASRVREVKALEIQAERAPPWLAERLNVIRDDMASGSSLPQALIRPRYAGRGFDFPSAEIVDTVEAIHGFEDFPGRMTGVQRQWVQELTARVKAAGTVIGVVGSALTYGVIIFITVASANLQNQLQERIGSASTHVQGR